MTLLRKNRLDWQRDGADWPNRAASQFVTASGLRWHLQVMGQGPVMLLLHGTAASTHSWRDLMPTLAKYFTVVAPDLPGHGFTDAPPSHRLSLKGMANAIAGLLRYLALSPEIVVGHSAGAPIAARLCLDQKIAPALVVGLNGAWLPFPGSSGLLFPLLARALFLNPFTPRFFAAMADTAAVERLISQTGSQLDTRGIALYLRLLRNSAHVSGALGMMANWDLESLKAALPRLSQDLLLIVGEDDQAVPPAGAETIARLVKQAEIQRLAGLGHLAHEEDPDLVAERIVRATQESLGHQATG